MKKKIKTVLTSKVETWNIEELDILLACFPSGDFRSIMIGSYALYKETQQCIVIGFTEQIEADQDLMSIENDVLSKIGHTMYCKDPSKQKALVIFLGSGDFNFAPELRAIKVSELQAISTPILSENEESLLYDEDIIRSMMNVLAIDVDDETSLALRQSQVQILKAISFLVDAEMKADGESKYLHFLTKNKLIMDLFSYIQRNSNKPELMNKNELNLPVSLLEIQLTSLRAYTLETNQSLIAVNQLSAYISSYDTIAFYDSTVVENKTKSFLKSMDVQSSINEDSLHPAQLKATYNVELFTQIQKNNSLIRQHQDIIVFKSEDFISSSDFNLLCNALQKATIIVIDDKLEAKEVYYQLKNLSKKHKFVDPPHLKAVFLLPSSDLQSLREFRENRSNEVVHIDTSVYNANKDIQFNSFISDLKDWAGFTDEQIQDINKESKTSEDAGVKTLLTLKKSILGSGEGEQYEKQKSNINKLLVGKMAFIGRKQQSIKQVDTTVYNDIGEQLWEQTFSKLDDSTFTSLINDKFINLYEKPQSSGDIASSREQAFANALNVKGIKDKDIEVKYKGILNKLIRLKSRTTIVTFLNYINPLPVDILNSLEQLDKIILMAFNEGLNICDLTGNDTLLKQVKLLIKRIIKEPLMKNFVNDFLINQIIKPGQQVVKKMYDDKSFMNKNVFDSEVDASMYANPQLIYSVTKLILIQYPELFNNIRGLLPNSVSILLGLTFAFVSKDASQSKIPTKFATLAARLMSSISHDPSLYPYLKDLANHTLLWKIQQRLNTKISKSKASEQSKILKEIYNDLTIISQFYSEQTHTLPEYCPHQQQVKFCKKVKFAKTKDPLTLLQISKDDGSVEQVRQKVIELSKTIKSHPLGMRVPFISKVKSIENSDMMKLHFLDTDFTKSNCFGLMIIDDQFKIFNDEQCTKRIGTTYIKPNEETQEIYKRQTYLSYSNSIANQLYSFGWGKQGRLATNEQGDELYNKDPKTCNETYLRHDVLKNVQTCKALGMILHTDGTAYKTGYCKTQSVYDYFCCSIADVKLISVGRNTYCAVQKNNDILVCGSPKDGDFDQATYYSENYYRQTSKPEELHVTNNILGISSGSRFTIFFTESGKLYGMGNKFLKEIGVEGDKIIRAIPLEGDLKVTKVWASKSKLNYSAIIEVVKGNEKFLMSAGIHAHGLLGQGVDVIQSDKFKRLDYDHQSIKFKKISFLTDHVLALTEDGLLYGWGSNEHYRLGMDKSIQRVYVPTLLPFNNSLKFRIHTIAAGDTHSFINVEEFDELGISLGLRLYQIGYDENEKENTQHRGVTKEELEANNFIARVKHLDGQQYSILRAGHKVTFFKPSEPPLAEDETFFTKTIQNEVSRGIIKRNYLHFYNNPAQSFTPFTLPPIPNEEELERDNLDQIRSSVQRASNLEENKENDLQKADREKNRQERIQMLEERRLLRLKQKAEIEQRRKELKDQDPQVKGWHFYEQAELFKNSNLFTGVSIALRHQIPQLYMKMDYFKELFDQALACVVPDSESFGYGHVHQGIICNDSNTEIVGKARYYASYEMNDQSKEIYLSEDAFAQPTEFDHMPLVYFRISQPLKDGAVLPKVDLSKLYAIPEEKPFKFEIKIYTNKYWFNNKQILLDYLKGTSTNDLQKLAFQTVFRGKYNQQHENQVIRFYQECSYDQIPQDLDSQFFSQEKEILKYLDTKKAPEEMKEELKNTIEQMKFLSRANFSSIQVCLFIVLQYFKQGQKIVNRISQRSLKNLLQSSLPTLRRTIIFSLPPYMKREILNTSIQSLPGGDRIEVCVRRRKAYAFQETGACDHEGTNTIFGQIMQILKKNEANNLKAFYQNSADGMAFRVEFKGEGSIDAGGPYRETLTNICNELQSSVLPILIPTPNNKNNHGDNRECYMLNPSNTSPTHLEMFKYFGHYIGFAIRSESALQLDLAPIFWKLIMGETANQTQEENEKDLKTFDTYSWQVIQDLRNNAAILSEDDFDAGIEESFVTHLSDGNQVELLAGGRHKKVTKANVEEFIKLVVDQRINESAKAIKSVIEGINQVIPLTICRLLNWKQIEIRATGSKVLDIQKLKNMTTYEGGSVNDPHITAFWQAIESFTDKERIMYLKFVWGRTRIPNSTDQKHKIVSMEYQPNRCLPISHTCFFTLDLPRYPSFEIARAKILIAIVFCGDIDADRDQYSIGTDE